MSFLKRISGFFTTAESYRVMSELLSPKGIAPNSIEAMHAGFADRYGRVCGETQNFQSALAGTAATGETVVDGRITQAIRGFFQLPSFDAGTRGVTSSIDEFEYYLQRNNCPEGSPAKILINDLIRRYTSLSQRIGHEAIPRIVDAMRVGDVRNGDLAGLKILADLLEAAPDAQSSLAYKLLDFIKWNNFLITPRFNDMAAELAAGFNPDSWANSIQSVFREVTLVNGQRVGSYDWQKGIVEGMGVAARGRDPVVRSLLVLLNRGDNLLLRKILYFMGVKIRKDDAQNSLYILLHAAASRSPSEGRRFLMDQAVKLVAKAYMETNYQFFHIIDPIIVLLGFEEADPAVEKTLGEFIEKVVDRKVDQIMRVQLANMVLVFAKHIRDLYEKMFKDRLDEHQRRQTASNSVVARAIGFAKAVRLDPALILDIEGVLWMEEEDGRQRLKEIDERYMLEVMGLAPRSRRNNPGGTQGAPPAGGGAPPAPSTPDMSGFSYEADVEEITRWDESAGMDEIYTEDGADDYYPEDYDYGWEDAFWLGAESYMGETTCYFEAAFQ